VSVTHNHRLIVPADANHHGTLYAGSLLRLALEAAYATAWRHVGPRANLLLRRVLNLECLRPVPVGTVIDLQGAVLHQTRAYVVIGLLGAPIDNTGGPWLEGILGFAQVDDAGRPDELPGDPTPPAIPDGDGWQRLLERYEKLSRLR
jgi:acyl-CoA thioesterase YciA